MSSKQFNYRTRDPDTGQVQHGQIMAATLVEARAQLRDRGVLITDLRPAHAWTFFSDHLHHRRLPLKDKILLTEQLSVMVKAGLPIGQALESIASEADNRHLRDMLADLAHQVEGGSNLADALGSYERAFGNVYIQMIRAGEESGTLDQILARLTDQLQKDYEIRAKVRSALIYPAIVVVMMVVVSIIVIIFVLPKLGKVFTDAGSSLPPTTRLLLSIASFFTSYGWWLLGAIVILAILWRLALRIPSIALEWDRCKLHIPIYGPSLRRVLMARFSLGFASLLAADLPVLLIFKTLGEMLDNRAYQVEIARISHLIENGQPVATALHGSYYFPAMISQLASIGEKTGHLDEMFALVASYYDKEVDTMTRNLSATLEPIIMVTLGIGITFILVSVLQPMYNLVNVL